MTKDQTMHNRFFLATSHFIHKLTYIMYMYVFEYYIVHFVNKKAGLGSGDMLQIFEYVIHIYVVILNGLVQTGVHLPDKNRSGSTVPSTELFEHSKNELYDLIGFT